MEVSIVLYFCKAAPNFELYSGAAKLCAGELNRVCQAWHVTLLVQIRQASFRSAEGQGNSNIVNQRRIFTSK
jgi:hypothetical protein